MLSSRPGHAEQVTGVRLTTYSHWMEDKHGLVLELFSDPQVLPRGGGGVSSPLASTPNLAIRGGGSSMSWMEVLVPHSQMGMRKP